MNLGDFQPYQVWFDVSAYTGVQVNWKFDNGYQIDIYCKDDKVSVRLRGGGWVSLSETNLLALLSEISHRKSTA